MRKQLIERPLVGRPLYEIEMDEHYKEVLPPEMWPENNRPIVEFATAKQLQDNPDRPKWFFRAKR